MLYIKTLALAGLLSCVSAVQALELRVREDPERDRRWILKPTGLHLHGLKSGRPLRHVPLPGWLWAGEPYGCTPDMAIGPHGEVVVTSDVAPMLWRVDGRSLTVSVLSVSLEERLDIGFSALVYLRDAKAYLAASPVGSYWLIDAGLTRARRTVPDQRAASRLPMPPCVLRAAGAAEGSVRSTGP